MKKYTLSIIALICIGYSLMAQNISDAVRYSYLNQSATAGVAGLGGSAGALGGDVGVLAINPAGIAEFRHGVFQVTPYIFGNNTTAQLNDNNAQETSISSRLGLGSIGIVFAGGNANGTFTTNNLSISLENRTFLKQNFFYSGMTQGSITQRFAERANGKTKESMDEYEAYPAYITGAIYDFDGDTYYDTDFKPTTQVNKSQDIQRYGRINEFNITWGGKINNEINVGLGIGIPRINYEEQKFYVESDEQDAIPTFDKLEYKESLITKGTGFNIKGGVQGVIAGRVRLGASIESPTWYSLEDNYDASLSYTYTDPNPTTNAYDSEDGRFEYSYTTPWKATGSAAVTLGNEQLRGIINADVEYIDYRNNNFDFGASSSNADDIENGRLVNKDIENQLSSAINFRLGGQLGIGKIRLRAGAAWTQSPFDLEPKPNPTIGAGIGFRAKSTFIDLSYNYANQKEGYVPYLLLDEQASPVVTTEQKKNQIGITIGFLF